MYPLTGVPKLELWSPPPPSQLLTHSKSAPTPKISPEVQLLTSSTGVSAEEFWSFWDYCAGCRAIVCAVLMPCHICDLTLTTTNLFLIVFHVLILSSLFLVLVLEA